MSYIQELKQVLTDPVAKKAACERVCKRRGWSAMWYEKNVFGWFDGDYKNYQKPSWKDFDRVENNRTRNTRFLGEEDRNGWWALTGVEILGQQPLATGHTWSNKCNLTLPQLKQACKQNGIKIQSKWKKQDYLHALLKV